MERPEAFGALIMCTIIGKNKSTRVMHAELLWRACSRFEQKTIVGKHYHGIHDRNKTITLLRL